MSEQPIDVPALAVHLDRSEQSIQKYARTGQIPAFKVGREWRFLLTDVMAHLTAPKDEWAQSSHSRGRRRK